MEALTGGKTRERLRNGFCVGGARDNKEIRHVKGEMQRERREVEKVGRSYS